MPTYEVIYQRTTVETIVNRFTSEGKYEGEELDEVGRTSTAWTVSQRKDSEIVEFVRGYEVEGGPSMRNVVQGTKMHLR